MRFVQPKILNDPNHQEFNVLVLNYLIINLRQMHIVVESFFQASKSLCRQTLLVIGELKQGWASCNGEENGERSIIFGAKNSSKTSLDCEENEYKCEITWQGTMSFNLVMLHIKIRQPRGWKYIAVQANIWGCTIERHNGLWPSNAPHKILLPRGWKYIAIQEPTYEAAP
mgnify:CR=1 FL=1